MKGFKFDSIAKCFVCETWMKSNFTFQIVFIFYFIHLYTYKCISSKHTRVVIIQSEKSIRVWKTIPIVVCQNIWNISYPGDSDEKYTPTSQCYNPILVRMPCVYTGDSVVFLSVSFFFFFTPVKTKLLRVSALVTAPSNSAYISPEFLRVRSSRRTDDDVFTRREIIAREIRVHLWSPSKNVYGHHNSLMFTAGKASAASMPDLTSLADFGLFVKAQKTSVFFIISSINIIFRILIMIIILYSLHVGVLNGCV